NGEVAVAAVVDIRSPHRGLRGGCGSVWAIATGKAGLFIARPLNSCANCRFRSVSGHFRHVTWQKGNGGVQLRCLRGKKDTAGRTPPAKSRPISSANEQTVSRPR
ncbi:hypothetical protein, partial [Rhodopseudomonas palustris]|uniref:hypothetical protein n=1 Tax=Rhodopseudomonas palustris TaxID=1076 RepID=UPI001AEC65B9